MTNIPAAATTAGQRSPGGMTVLIYKMLNRTLLLTFGLGTILVVGGLSLALLPVPIETGMEFSGFKITTTSIGVSMASLGVALVGFVVKKIIGVLNAVAAEGATSS